MLKNLHIAPSEKFISSYIQFIENNFDVNEQLFLIGGDLKKHNIKEDSFVIELKKKLIRVISFK